MEKICGFKGLDGLFYETEEKCEKADLQFKIKSIERKLDNFSSSVNSRLWNYYYSITPESFIHSHTISSEIQILVTQVILQHSDTFLEIIEEKKNLVEELNSLQKELEYKNKWWMKIKWW